MYFPIIIGSLFVISLILYFIFSKKVVRQPSVATEILFKKYNSKVKLLSRFLKKNLIEFNLDIFSSLSESDLNNEAIENNLDQIEAIKFNFETITKILNCKKLEEAQQLLSQLKALKALSKFAAELEQKEDIKKLFELFDFSKTKLNFEFKKYFGSQDFYNLFENQIFFLDNFQALKIDQKNIFDCKIEKYQIIIKKIGKNKDNSDQKLKNALIFSLTITLGEEELEKELLVYQKDLIEFLQKLEVK